MQVLKSEGPLPLCGAQFVRLKNVCVAFGGLSSKVVSSLVIIDPERDELYVRNTQMSPHINHAMCVLNDKLIVFGGTNVSKATKMYDFNESTIINSLTIERTAKGYGTTMYNMLPLLDAIPKLNIGYSIAPYSQDELLIWGGNSRSCYLTNVRTSACRVLIELPVTVSTTVYTIIDGRIYCFGGFLDGIPSNRVFMLELPEARSAAARKRRAADAGRHSGPRWKFLSHKDGAAYPSIRSGHAVAAYKSFMLLFGGVRPDGTLLNDLWAFDTGSSRWAEIVPAIEQISCRANALVCCYDDNLIIYGGMSETLIYSDFYTINLKTVLSSGQLKRLFSQAQFTPAQRRLAAGPDTRVSHIRTASDFLHPTLSDGRFKPYLNDIAIEGIKSIVTTFGKDVAALLGEVPDEGVRRSVLAGFDVFTREILDYIDRKVPRRQIEDNAQVAILEPGYLKAPSIDDAKRVDVERLSGARADDLSLSQSDAYEPRKILTGVPRPDAEAADARARGRARPSAPKRASADEQFARQHIGAPISFARQQLQEDDAADLADGAAQPRGRSPGPGQGQIPSPTLSIPAQPDGLSESGPSQRSTVFQQGNDTETNSDDDWEDVPRPFAKIVIKAKEKAVIPQHTGNFFFKALSNRSEGVAATAPVARPVIQPPVINRMAAGTSSTACAPAPAPALAEAAEQPLEFQEANTFNFFSNFDEKAYAVVSPQADVAATSEAAYSLPTMQCAAERQAGLEYNYASQDAAPVSMAVAEGATDQQPISGYDFDSNVPYDSGAYGDTTYSAVTPYESRDTYDY